MIRPSSFPGDAYGYATNQAGHAYLVGFPAALLIAPWWGLIAAPVIAGVAYALVWEWAVQGWYGWDSFEDSLHVLCGAAVACSALSGQYAAVVAMLAAQVALLVIGAWRRGFRL